MSRKVQVYISSEKVERNGLLVVEYTKRCPICHKEYKTTSRGQKYCSDACCAKSQKKKYRQQKEYSKTKEVARLSSRAHAIAVDIMNYLDVIGERPKQCSCCGTTENLQVHHVDLNWLNNSPSNLVWVCPKCHSTIHAELEAEVKANGKTMDDIYHDDFKPIISVLNKNCQ